MKSLFKNDYLVFAFIKVERTIKIAPLNAVTMQVVIKDLVYPCTTNHIVSVYVFADIHSLLMPIPSMVFENRTPKPIVMLQPLSKRGERKIILVGLFHVSSDLVYPATILTTFQVLKLSYLTFDHISISIPNYG